ncbi:MULTISPECIES: hypothetical protein [Cycloclasticus]|jgi:hypothetical protein|uniref:Uncharacterized protein n=1 Tax=Cycloclasticus pugetii TaxID=34068 RepID=A0AB33Z450_9GAMM|nr:MULTISPECIES: hypothetical protein [Cycloclasticus]ATI03453.1 hypothetical protein CPC19_08230 [Cycloclasticus sp. PY97N]EPD13932.1 hypothetical protein L196_00495 [Cycloclasticus pugetii]
MDNYELEKAVWSEQDFQVMGWHDGTVWSMTANSEDFEFLLDLDYIFKWVDPKENETYYKFWVSPVTMVFENAHDVVIDIESQQGNIEIAELVMEEPRLSPNGRFTQHTYRFECQEGAISIVATGFKMYVRQNPKLVEVQSLGLNERNGINFGREINAI